MKEVGSQVTVNESMETSQPTDLGSKNSGSEPIDYASTPFAIDWLPRAARAPTVDTMDFDLNVLAYLGFLNFAFIMVGCGVWHS